MSAAPRSSPRTEQRANTDRLAGRGHPERLRDAMHEDVARDQIAPPRPHAAEIAAAVGTEAAADIVARQLRPRRGS